MNKEETTAMMETTADALKTDGAPGSPNGSGSDEKPYRVAPPGFTSEQRGFFDREGYLILPERLSEDEIVRYRDAIDRYIASDPKLEPGAFCGRENVVESDPVFAELIDHPRHVGYAYDFYGELLKLHISQFFVRPRGGGYNKWHPDGARAVPYQVFSPDLPCQIKVAYWLTDLPEPKMGNLVIRPRSQRQQYFEGYDTDASYPDELIVCAPRGTVMLFNGNLWHRVEDNESDVARKNLFLAYCPSWIVAADRLSNDPEWLKTLNREQRIIMRSYSHAYDHTKPPASDFPLFLDRDTGLDHDPDRYHDRVAKSRRKRLLAHEKLFADRTK